MKSVDENDEFALESDIDAFLKEDGTLTSSNEWYVDGNKAEDGNGSVDNPFNNLKSSINKSKDGDTIYIAPGTYKGSGLNVNLSIDKGVNLISSGGGDVILDGDNSCPIFNVSAYSLNITGLTFTRGYSEGNGGAIYFANGLNNSKIDATFINNSAVNGGAIYFSGKFTNNVINSSFVNNSAERAGGAIYIRGDAVNNTFTSEFYGNDANYASGGGIFFSGNAKGNVFESTFEHNYAYYGAGMFFYKSANSNRFRSDFRFNVAESCGGAMFFYKTTDKNTFKGKFINNSALGNVDVTNGNGGAITFKNTSSNSIFECDFINNFAYLYGGGVNYRETPYNITFNSNFINNYGKYGGGVNFFDTLENVVLNGDLINNSAVYGGGVCIGYGEIEYGHFIDNSAIYGGAIFFNGTGSAHDVEVINSYASEGGAIFANGNLTVENAVFENNHADEGTNHISLNVTEGTVTLSNVTPEEIGPYKIANLSVVDLSVEDIVKLTAIVTWKGNAVNEGNVSVTIEGKKYSAKVENGIATVEIPDLVGGPYTANATFEAGQYYDNPSQTVTFSLPKKDTALITPNRVISVTEGVNGYEYQFILKDVDGNVLAGKEVSVAFNGKNQTIITDDAGWGTVAVYANAEGSYNATITFTGDDRYGPITQNGTIKLVKEKTAFVAPDRTVYVQQMSRGYTYSAILKDVNGKPLANKKVLFIFNGQKQVTYTDETGWATVKLTAVTAGTQSVTIKFAGDRYYRETETTRTIKIVQEASKLTVDDCLFKSTDKTKPVVAKLESKSGAPVNGAKLSFNVNGITYSATTDGSGIAIFFIDLNEIGIFNALTSFETSRFFKEISATSKIVIV